MVSRSCRWRYLDRERLGLAGALDTVPRSLSQARAYCLCVASRAARLLAGPPGIKLRVCRRQQPLPQRTDRQSAGALPKPERARACVQHHARPEAVPGLVSQPCQVPSVERCDYTRGLELDPDDLAT